MEDIISTNAQKQQHGQNAHNNLEVLLNSCHKKGYIKSITKNYRVGHSGYENEQQFYAPFLIEFYNGSQWVLFATTSMRTDRIKGQQWDAFNLKKINPKISKVYLVYPDGISTDEKNEFIRQNNKYKNLEEYSLIDAIISQDLLFNYIENQAFADRNKGQVKDIQGKSFEIRVAEIINYKENLTKWKKNSLILDGLHYNIFEKIVNCFSLKPQEVDEIHATSDKKIIGKLPSGGNPKTDILVIVKGNGTTTNYTISCKRSEEQSVTVHQYCANDFADVLDKNNDKLRTLLNVFQEAGCLRNMGKDNIKALTQELKPYLKPLSLWVLGGFGGSGNIIQCASYILTYNNNNGETNIHKIEDYCNELAKDIHKKQFGTPFSWTYPSKQRGKYIKLRCDIINRF